MGTLLTGMRVLDQAGLDDIQSEVVTSPVPKMMFVTDELHWRGNETGNGNRADRHEGEVDARTPATGVYHVHHQDPPRKLLPERGEPVPLGEHLRRETQKAI